MTVQTSQKSSWPQKRLLRTAFLLWPLTTLLTDILGYLFLNRFFPRNDFGLFATTFSMPICFITGLLLLIRWSRFRYPDRFEQFTKGLATCLLYLLFFGFWTFLAYPLGRVSSNF